MEIKDGCSELRRKKDEWVDVVRKGLWRKLFICVDFVWMGNFYLGIIVVLFLSFCKDVGV